MIELPNISNENIVKPVWGVQILNQKEIVPKSDEYIKNVRDRMKEISQQIVIFFDEDIYENIDEEYKSIADFDTFISFNGSHSSKVVQNAVEQGSFRSVNKTKEPTSCVVELGKGGSPYGIENMLNNLKKYQGGTETFRIITPYGNIENLNFIKLEYNYSKESGVGLLIAKLHFQEIIYGTVREEMYSLITTNSPDKTNTQSSGNKAPVSMEK